MNANRIVLFGGTFDPIHVGHTTVAGAAAAYLDADKLIFIPAKRSPLKGFLPSAGDTHRLKMIELAIQTNDRFEVSDCELQRPAPSYTIDTVKHFQQQYGASVSIYWLLGADSLEDLTHWYKAKELIDACNLAVMHRGGYPTPTFEEYLPIWGPERIEKLHANVIETPSIDISSTEVRKRLAEGSSTTDVLDPRVADYIARNGLYARR